MRRTLLLTAAAIGIVAPPAGAASIEGTPRADRLLGTQRADTIRGRGGADLLVGRAGADRAEGGAGADRSHSSTTAAATPLLWTGTRPRERRSRRQVAADCEVVTLPISVDPFPSETGQHRTQVEPDSLAHGSTVVSAFQPGRFFDGGAANIGVSTSSDAGRTWTPSFLPGLSLFGSPPDLHPRVSDPVVAYDDARRRWLVGTLGVSPGLTGAARVSHSADGLAWEPPVTAARAARSSLAYDKEWLVCDSWPASPFRGRCYLGYTDTACDVLVARRAPTAVRPGAPR